MLGWPFPNIQRHSRYVYIHTHTHTHNGCVSGDLEMATLTHTHTHTHTKASEDASNGWGGGRVTNYSLCYKRHVIRQTNLPVGGSAPLHSTPHTLPTPMHVYHTVFIYHMMVLLKTEGPRGTLIFHHRIEHCMYVYMDTYIPVCLHACMHACMYVCI